MINKLQIAILALVGLIAALGMTHAVRADDSAAPIGVLVDNNPVAFPGAQPVEVHGSVLVPLRGVFEALGARVDYDPATATIRAFSPGRRIVLAIGSPTASINDQPQDLSQPAQVVNGTTLVPLRFVAEALGDYVEWQAATRQVFIQRQGPSPDVEREHPRHHDRDVHNAPPPPMPPPPVVAPPVHHDRNVIEGVIHGLKFDGFQPAIQVDAFGGQRMSIRLSEHLTIQRGHDRQHTEVGALSDIVQGDHVWIHLDPRGKADSITAINDRYR